MAIVAASVAGLAVAGATGAVSGAAAVGGGRRDEEEKWVPVAKLGRLHQIIDTLLGGRIKDEVMKILPVAGKCGSVTVLMFAGIEDVFTSSRGSTKTLGNFVTATFEYLMKTYRFLTPDVWMDTRFSKSPFQEYTDLRAKPAKAILLDNTEKDES
ncbi:unnamed protein product [Musa hybrid cultivar]